MQNYTNLALLYCSGYMSITHSLSILWGKITCACEVVVVSCTNCNVFVIYTHWPVYTLDSSPISQEHEIKGTIGTVSLNLDSWKLEKSHLVFFSLHELYLKWLKRYFLYEMSFTFKYLNLKAITIQNPQLFIPQAKFPPSGLVTFWLILQSMFKQPMGHPTNTTSVGSLFTTNTTHVGSLFTT